MKALDALSLKLAVLQHVCGEYSFLGDELLDVHQKLADNEPGVEVYEPFAQLSGSVLADIIEARADAIKAVVVEALRLTKQGVALAAIEGTLDSDVNNWDMQALLESGSATEGEPQ